MKFQFYQEKLVDSKEYKKFKKENPSAYFCSAFFALDRENNRKNDQVNFDFWLPKFEKMYSFKLSGPVEFVNVENFDKRPFEKLPDNFVFDLEKIEKIILERMEKEEIKGDIHKLLFSLQKLDGISYLVITIFLNNFAMLKVNYNLDSDKIVHFEKKSFLDMLKIIKKKD